MPDSERRCSAEMNLADNALPIPIQMFLWKQVSPFVRPKLGKLHEASCSFCQHAMTGHHELKEACKSFERVLVQNIKSGLKPDLTEAMKSIPRWRLIQASLPHVMHAVASILYNRMKDGNIQTLGAVETKLLYTLHWIILDAVDECTDEDYEKGIYHSSPFYYLFSIPTITLFVYLFAPICNNLKESDFQNFRLENGLKIWQAMWEFRHPEAPCFVTHCKPKPKLLNGKNMKAKAQFGDVFLGREMTEVTDNSAILVKTLENSFVCDIENLSNEKRKPLKVLGECFDKYYIGYVMQKNSPFTKIFNRYSFLYYEYGLLKYWFKISVKELRAQHVLFQTYLQEEQAFVNLSKLKGSFYCLMFAYFVSILIFIFEIVFYKCSCYILVTS